MRTVSETHVIYISFTDGVCFMCWSRQLQRSARNTRHGAFPRAYGLYGIREISRGIKPFKHFSEIFSGRYFLTALYYIIILLVNIEVLFMLLVGE